MTGVECIGWLSKFDKRAGEPAYRFGFFGAPNTRFTVD